MYNFACLLYMSTDSYSSRVGIVHRDDGSETSFVLVWLACFPVATPQENARSPIERGACKAWTPYTGEEQLGTIES